MSKKEKLLEKLRNNPKGIRFKEIDLILTWYGFERRQSGKGSSHYVYKLGHHTVTIVYYTSLVHADAVREVLRIIDELEEMSR